MKKIKYYTCKTCGKETYNKYNKIRTYCSKSCKNNDPDLTKKSNNKRKKTNLDRYNGHPMNNKHVQNKHKSTMLKKYNALHALQVPTFKQKSSQTKLNRYGDKNYNNFEQIKETKLKKYGSYTPNLINYYTLRRNLKLSWRNIKILDDIYKVDLTKPVNIQCTLCGREWSVILDNNYIPSCKFCSSSYTKTSKGHQDIKSFLQRLVPDATILDNDRFLLNGDEIDLYLPDFNLAIEYNGIYYHSSKFKNKYYHLNKTRRCSWKGVTLLHISEYDWLSKPGIIKSMLKSKLGKLPFRVYARKCRVVQISPNIKKQFLSNNHIQGDARSSINIGLYHGTKLVSVMTFSKSRYESNYHYELVRSAVKQDYHIVGGFSKGLSFFIKTWSPKSILSYAKRDYSTGGVYIANKFTFLGFTKPGYKYVKNSTTYPRQKFQKHKLPLLFPNVNMSLTEQQIMEKQGYYRLYDSGNLKFGLIINY